MSGKGDMEISLLAIGDRPENYAFRLLKAILEGKGYRVNLIYLNVCRLHSKTTLTQELREQLLSIIKGSSIIGAYIFTFNFHLAIEITRYIRANIDALILWGGAHAIAAPEECTQYADIVCINEGEEALVEIVEKYEKYGRDFDKSGIPNIAYRLGGGVKYNAIKRLDLSLDNLPYPDSSFVRHYYVDSENQLVPFTLEAIKGASGGKFTYITMISRGCPFRCTFCLNSNENRIPYYNGRSVDNVIGELKEVKRQFGGGIDEVMFYDDDFFALPIEYIREFSAKYKEQVGIPISPLNASAVNFSEEKIVQLKYAGVKGVSVGIQSISANGREAYHNPATKERIIRIMEVMTKHPDLRVILHIILGNPYENEDDIVENLLFLNSLPRIYELSPYQLIIYPGTKLFGKVKNDPEHQVRANEGYYLPYYYAKPELSLWNHLAKAYLNQKKGFPWYVRYMLEKRHYPLLKSITKLRVNTGIVNTSIRDYGITATLKKIKDRVVLGQDDKNGRNQEVRRTL